MRFFNQVTHDMFHDAASRSCVAVASGKGKKAVAIPLPELDGRVTTILDLGGVSGAMGSRRRSTTGVTSLDGPIDVTDADFRQGEGVWGKWIRLRGMIGPSTPCAVCDAPLAYKVTRT